MPLKSIFTQESTSETLSRLSKLQPDTQPQWGKMNAAQMLAHLNVAYDVTYGKIPVKNSAFGKFMLKLFVKKMVVEEHPPYKKNSRTAPYFLIEGDKNFEEEKDRLIENIKKTEALGAAHFDGLESPSFGPLTARQWSTQFAKHLDHHFRQFGI